MAEALGRTKVAYLALSGVRDLKLGDEKLEASARAACLAANNLECDLRVALLPPERRSG